MSQFYQTVKEHVTARQAAEFYGYKVGRNGMMRCPFHDDRNPSMKIDKNFICFGGQEKGDVITFVSRLFGLSAYDAACKLVEDMRLPVEIRKGSGRKKPDVHMEPWKTKCLCCLIGERG